MQLKGCLEKFALKRYGSLVLALYISPFVTVLSLAYYL